MKRAYKIVAVLFVAIALAAFTVACATKPVTTVSSVSKGPSKAVIILIAGPILMVGLFFFLRKTAWVKKDTQGLKEGTTAAFEGRKLRFKWPRWQRQHDGAISLSLTRTASQVEADLAVARSLRDGTTKGTPNWEARNLLVQELKQELERFKLKRYTRVQSATSLRTRALVEVELATARRKRDVASGPARVEAQRVVDSLKAKLVRFAPPVETREITPLRTAGVIEGELAEARVRRGKYPEGSDGWNRHNPRVQRLKKELAARQPVGQKKA